MVRIPVENVQLNTGVLKACNVVFREDSVSIATLFPKAACDFYEHGDGRWIKR